MLRGAVRHVRLLAEPVSDRAALALAYCARRPEQACGLLQTHFSCPAGTIARALDVLLDDKGATLDGPAPLAGSTREPRQAYAYETPVGRAAAAAAPLATHGLTVCNLEFTGARVPANARWHRSIATEVENSTAYWAAGHSWYPSGAGHGSPAQCQARWSDGDASDDAAVAAGEADYH